MIFYLLVGLLILEYVRPGGYIPALNALRLHTIVPMAVIAVALATKSKVSTQQLLQEANTRLVLTLVVLVTFSVLLADVTTYAFSIFGTVVGYTMLYWIMATHVTEISQIKGVMKTLVLIHVALVALSPGLFTSSDDRYRILAGTFLGDGNDFALSVNLCLAFTLYLMFDAVGMRRKVFYALVAILLVLVVVATKSRGGTLGLGAMGFYYWLNTDRKAATGSLIVAAVLLVLAMAPASYFNRMNTISASPQDGSAQNRLRAWQSGMRMAIDHPVFGVGAGQFSRQFGTTYRPNNEEPGTPWKTAHSIYFLVLGELGLPGITVLLWLIFGNLAVNRRILKRLRAGPLARSSETRLVACLSACLIAYAVAGAFLSAAYYPHIFLLAALTVSARRLVRLREAAGTQSQLVAAGAMPVPLTLPAIAWRPISRQPAGVVQDRASVQPDTYGRFF